MVANAAYLGARWGFDQGFDVFDARRPPPFVPELPRPLLAAAFGAGLRAARPDLADAEGEAYRPAEAIRREAVSLLDRAARQERPTLLFVNFMDPHWPYDPPAPFDTRYPGRLPEPPGIEAFRAARLQRRPFDARERQHLVSQYDGEIAYADQELGRLFDHLRRLGWWERSLVIVTSDHGEAFGEHGLFSHGVSVHQHQVHVPLLIKRPGQRSGEVSDRWVGSVDLLPTVLDFAGLPLPDGLAGVSLRHEPPPDRFVLAESHPDPVLFRAHPRFRRSQHALFAGDAKLVSDTPGGRRLYDLVRDPAEQRDRLASDPRAAAMERQLEAWLEGRAASPGAPVTLDDDERARLRALGYDASP